MNDQAKVYSQHQGAREGIIDFGRDGEIGNCVKSSVGIYNGLYRSHL